MEYLKIFVELVKAVAWPGTVFFIVYWFKDEIKKLIPFTTKAGPTGLEFNPGRQSTTVSTIKDLRELPGLPRTPMMGAVETVLHQSLNAFPGDEQVDVLIRHLAQSRLETTFERVYRNIFGSQIEALKLAVGAGGAVDREDAEKFFQELKKKHSDFYAKSTLEEWLAFLINAGLISAQNQKLSVTDYGRDFLTYLEAQGLPTNKPW